MWPQPRNGIVCFLAFLSRKNASDATDVPNSRPDYVYNDDDDDAGAELELWPKDVASDNDNNENKSK